MENSEENLRNRDENQQQTQTTMTSTLGIKPRPHWWEASALITVPTLHLSIKAEMANDGNKTLRLVQVKVQSLLLCGTVLSQ